MCNKRQKRAERERERLEKKKTSHPNSKQQHNKTTPLKLLTNMLVKTRQGSEARKLNMYHIGNAVGYTKYKHQNKSWVNHGAGSTPASPPPPVLLDATNMAMLETKKRIHVVSIVQ